MDAAESKALRLARYLKEFVGLRSSTIRDLEKYELVLWLGDIPQEPECRSPAWTDGFEPGDPWLEVRKQQFLKPPSPPEITLPWVDQHALKQATTEMPPLRPTRLESDLGAEIGDEEEPPLIERHLTDYPEVISAYEHYRPGWQAWSDEYRRRSGIQEVYAELFRMHTQIRKQGEIVELVLGLGLLDWQKPTQGQAAPIRRHIVVARVDLGFDPATGVIRLEGAADGAQLRIEDDMLEPELRPERSQYAVVDDQLRNIGDDVWDRPKMYMALKSWAGALHADSEWLPDLKPTIGRAEKPRVSFAPALILRKRTQVGMARTYDAIIDQLKDGCKEPPRGWGGLTDDEDDHDESETGQVSDDGMPRSHSGPKEVYFPLPANREQRRIVDAIDQRRGVLVQGPPGTGKSHTIANLVCHLLATGKRVLITAETGRALQVLKDKIPKEIQPLCVSLLGQSGDSFSELNSAVQGITTRYASWGPGAYDRAMAEADRELDARRRSLAEIDAELRSLRQDEIQPHSLMDGIYQGTASAIAERVASERERFGWLQVPQESANDPPVGRDELTKWLYVLREYDDEALARAQLRIIDSKILPSPEKFGLAVVAEREAEENVQKISHLQNHIAHRSISSLDTSERIQLIQELKKLNNRRIEIIRLDYDWLFHVLADALAGRSAHWKALLDLSKDLVEQIGRLIEGLGTSTVTIPPEKEAKIVSADAMIVVEHLRSGGKWKKLGFFTPKAVKERGYLRDRVAVDGQPADTEDRLLLVCKYIDLNFAFDELERVWRDCGRLPSDSAPPPIRLAAIKEHVAYLGKALDYAETCVALGRKLSARTPAIAAPDWLTEETGEWLDILDASGIEERYRFATAQVMACLRDLKVISDLHDAHPVLASLVEAVERREVAAYSQAYDTVRQVERTRADQEFRKKTESALATTVPGFVDIVSDTVEDTAWDDRFADWKEAWQWAIVDNWLRKRLDFLYQQQLWQRRHATDKQIGELLANAAALRAWTYFFDRLSNSNKQAAALKGWRETVRAMGRGTGRSARLERLRREARKYMEQCREAIPVWIMPRYLVAEMVNPAPNRYDLVIVDEASQLGIESLFLFYIAKKIIVVGDDQQISPYGVGISDQAIADLQRHYLTDIPHHNALSAQSSLYANAKIRFGQNIVLREHFRCMPEIIQFSNDLCYASNGTPLDPLRAYPANRLIPLVVRQVSGGYRTGSSQNAVNEPEAEAIVAQISACIDDPRYAGRTMGVISLQGEAQAKLIERKLLEKIDEVDPVGGTTRTSLLVGISAVPTSLNPSRS